MLLLLLLSMVFERVFDSCDDCVVHVECNNELESLGGAAECGSVEVLAVEVERDAGNVMADDSEEVTVAADVEVFVA